MTARSRSTQQNPRSARQNRYEAERREKSQRARSHYARVKQRKATRGVRRAALALAFGVAFAAGYTAGNSNSAAWLAEFEAPGQPVARISVLGHQRLDASEIAQRSGIEHGATLDAIDLAEAETRIGSHPWLRSARLRRLPGGELLAIVEEREAIAALSNESASIWRAVDRDGTAFAPIDPSAHADLLRLRCDAASASAEELSAAIALARLVETSGIARPAAILLPATDGASSEIAMGWRLVLADGGPEVVLGAEPSAERLSRLAELLDAQLDEVRSAERIDLRFRDRAILRASDAAPAEDANAAANEDKSVRDSARFDGSGGRPASV